MLQASSEHPLGKAVVEYARHFHFFEPSESKDSQKSDKGSKYSGWLLDVSDFNAVPGRGVRCFIDGKQILVSFGPLCNRYMSNRRAKATRLICLNDGCFNGRLETVSCSLKMG